MELWSFITKILLLFYLTNNITHGFNDAISLCEDRDFTCRMLCKSSPLTPRRFLYGNHVSGSCDDQDVCTCNDGEIKQHAFYGMQKYNICAFNDACTFICKEKASFINGYYVNIHG
ncbi:hypothetical protein [Trichoplusia ni ascovirus 2c]|uniref:hypothetical protein n=1 Tax=Trichoplusia ni ascovirus 2c TaxID=328615 RepID=UPI0000E4421E|nr:hypothetical protein TNAV2c_gp070 [Trichoplusia ni ascovirus 2c]ABF70587.1 hypothetical protein [Trichoplusia ni ascovirus 2c]